ncbi:MAG: S9 family peptidase [Saprospiraceae bacterium]|nr:S9 family peptidase [Saprospiraceae bacterium]
MKIHWISFLFLLLSIRTTNAQKPITIDDIYAKFAFRTKSVPGFNFMKDGRHYSSLKDGGIKKFDITTGSLVETMFEGKEFKDKAGYSGAIGSYTFSDDESKILIESESEAIYRHSSKANCYVYDVKSKVLSRIYLHGKVVNPAFSPDGEQVGFVFNNNLYFQNLKSGNITQVTTDGVKNKIINGMCDWVYEEEFSFTRAFYWSPDSKKIAYIRFDETNVPEFTMQLFKGDMYPENETFKYPKVGEKNAEVSAWVYELSRGKSKKTDIGELSDMYIPRMKWTQDAHKLCIFKMNRHQNNLKLYISDIKSGKSSIIYEETNKYYIDMSDDLTFLRDGKHFVWSSEKEGYNQIYLMGMDGTQKVKLTTGSYDVTSFYGVDEKNKKVYFQAAEKSPMQKHVFSVDLDGKNITNLTPTLLGSNTAQFSCTFDYFSNNHSTINTAPTFTVYDRTGKKIRTIEDNINHAKTQEEYGVSPVEFFTFTTSENVKLNGWMIKPRDFNPTRKYPVFMTQYSGPGSQSVTDSWKGTGYWWNQMIAQAGYIVVCVDGRGTGARGEAFKKMTYLQLGHFETLDQIETAKYMGLQPYVDKARIGIFGWSYGGYMSSLCILKGNDVFKAAIAVAPVTNWKWYDSIYTERYMRTTTENAQGYADNSPVYFADRLKGNYLLIHGMADDNVHFQNAVEMANALIKANKQFDTYYYPNRNHGIYGDNATIHLYTKMTNFIFEKI